MEADVLHVHVLLCEAARDVNHDLSWRWAVVGGQRTRCREQSPAENSRTVAAPQRKLLCTNNQPESRKARQEDDKTSCGAPASGISPLPVLDLNSACAGVGAALLSLDEESGLQRTEHHPLDLGHSLIATSTEWCGKTRKFEHPVSRHLDGGRQQRKTDELEQFASTGGAHTLRNLTGQNRSVRRLLTNGAQECFVLPVVETTSVRRVSTPTVTE